VSWFSGFLLSQDAMAYMVIEPASLSGNQVVASWPYKEILPFDGTNVALTTFVYIDTYAGASGPVSIYASSARYAPPGWPELEGVVYTFLDATGAHITAFYATDGSLTAAIPLEPGGRVKFAALVYDTFQGDHWILLDQVLTIPQGGLQVYVADALPGTYVLGFMATDVAGNFAAAAGQVLLQ
jgi:hypothetical protein